MLPLTPYERGYLAELARLDAKGEGIACGKGWIAAGKKCSKDKARSTDKKNLEKTKNSRKAQQAKAKEALGRYKKAESDYQTAMTEIASGRGAYEKKAAEQAQKDPRMAKAAQKAKTAAQERDAIAAKQASGELSEADARKALTSATNRYKSARREQRAIRQQTYDKLVYNDPKVKKAATAMQKARAEREALFPSRR